MLILLLLTEERLNCQEVHLGVQLIGKGVSQVWAYVSSGDLFFTVVSTTYDLYTCVVPFLGILILSLPYEKHLVFCCSCLFWLCLILLYIMAYRYTMSTSVQTEVLGTLSCACMSITGCTGAVVFCGVEFRGWYPHQLFPLSLLSQGFLLYPELTELASLMYRFVLGDPIYTLSTRIMGRLPHPSWIPVGDGDLSFSPHSYVGVSPIELSSKFYVFPKWREDWFLLNT